MESSSHVLLSSDRMDWRTPEWFLDLVREVNRIDCDPATSEGNPTRALVYFTQKPGGGCGLGTPWPSDGLGLTFINPPYGAHLSGPVEPDYEHWRKDRKTGERKLVGIGRGWAERIARHRGEYIALVPVRTETAWWKRLFLASTLTLLWGSDEHGSRISFVDPETGDAVNGSNLASAVFYSGSNPRRFAEVFGPHGLLVSPASDVAAARVVEAA